MLRKRFVSNLSATEVGARLGLGADYTAWLEMLDSLGGEPLPPTGIPREAGIEHEDEADIRAALPNQDTPAEWRWLLERAYHAVRTDIGVPEGKRPMPLLPPDLGVRGRCFWIVVFLCAVADIRRWHATHGVSDEISRDTLADLGRHVRLYRKRTGYTGLDTHWWISLHFRGGLFAIGRLQYTPFHLQTGPGGPLFWYDEATAAALGPGFRRGDAALGLHIPETGPLTPAQCAESFRSASVFFAEHFTEYAGAIGVCTSWLLDDQLLEYLEADSNIVAFQRRFELVPGARESDSSAFHFVFARSRAAPEDVDALEPHTTLERAIVQHVRNGGHWRMRTGWLRL
jgi:hypothetical protein